MKWLLATHSVFGKIPIKKRTLLTQPQITYQASLTEPHVGPLTDLVIYFSPLYFHYNAILRAL